MRVGFIGAGAVGSTLARAFGGAGVEVAAVASRTFDHARRLAAELPDCVAWSDPQRVVDHSDLVFLSVPDDAIASVCGELVWDSDTAAVHCSGALTVAELSAAAEAGAPVGSCHPMQTFAGTGAPGDHVWGCMFGIEAEDPELRGGLDDLVRRIGGWSLVLSSDDKATYHLAGVLASNYLVTLVASASSLLQSLNLSAEDAVRGLTPLIRGTVSNLSTRGAPAALTGPISRGDVGTVERHLTVLAVRHRSALPLYIESGRQTVLLARDNQFLTANEADQLMSLFDNFDEGAPDPAGNGTENGEKNYDS